MYADYLKLVIDGVTHGVFDMRYGTDLTVRAWKWQHLRNVAARLQAMFPSKQITNTVADRSEYADWAGLTA